ncbi:hypothetical protein BOTBODRAFT_57190 [Botryobasidium botryosum FD-172 SS1]|uniref:Uncharacterized protein n=1 Tax=Botryobasidium botryosum (strain FD-172 SS1) TaxID=930990 RepID=A0A067MAP0_BOTB1|nr:hypothetical protein BOTBODRAFT_57190 [Botryobasidium botryosum FD-172 SS1]
MHARDVVVSDSIIVACYSFIMIEGEDAHARNHSHTPEFVSWTYFGHLLRIFVLELPTSSDLRSTSPKTLVLALV